MKYESIRMARFAAVALVSLVCAMPMAARAQASAGTGKVVTDFGIVDTGARAVALQRDGKIVVAGTSRKRFALARYNLDGSLDTSFGTGGKVTTTIANSRVGISSVAIEADGRIVAAGGISADVTEPKTSDVAVVRYLSDGTLDASFGKGGLVTTDFGTSDGASDVAIQGDGRIVIAVTTDQAFAAARYNADGSLDTRFGTGGKVVTAFGGFGTAAYALAIQADGRIVLQGEADTAQGGSAFGLVRYQTDGSLDPTFGVGGKVTTAVTDYINQGGSVALQGDGRIVVAGMVSERTGTAGSDFAVLRYNANGSLDTTFGKQGTTRIEFSKDAFDTANAVAVQGDGRIVVMGETFAQNGPNSDFGVARFNTDGSLDPTFGASGKVTTDFGNGYDYGWALAIQGDGRIVAVGRTDPQQGFPGFAVARYNPNGALDTTFGGP